ncbi:MAG: thermonuclease family protein [Vampirovibrionales bacterium]|nr:thermonuclease family protein [Vampirovibrionales bacterium]
MPRRPRFTKKQALMIVGLSMLMGQFLWQHMRPGHSFEEDSSRTSCRVLRVNDGDTFSCDLNGNGRVDAPIERIRLLGIDTPETRYGLSKRLQKKVKKGQPFSEEAKAFTEKQLPPYHTVSLSWDVSRQDRYGRSLAVVYVSPSDTQSLNERLLAEGLAVTLFYEPNTRDKSKFEAIEQAAFQARKGLWKTHAN